MLIFDKNYSLRYEEILTEKYRFFSISKKGLLLGKNFDADIEKLYIFKLQI
jgi:hypothetical protein